MSGEAISLLAVLTAKPGHSDALRQALQALLLPTNPGAIRKRWTRISPCRTSRILLRRWIACLPGRCGWII